ncbi:unnamed protein product [Sphagnum balticum]
MEVCLLMNFSNIIMSKILVPHEEFFRYEVVSSSANRKKVLYPHVPIEYEGELRRMCSGCSTTAVSSISSIADEQPHNCGDYYSAGAGSSSSAQALRNGGVLGAA